MAFRDELFDAVVRELFAILNGEAHQQRKVVFIHVDRVVYRLVDAVEPGQKFALPRRSLSRASCAICRPNSAQGVASQ